MADNKEDRFQSTINKIVKLAARYPNFGKALREALCETVAGKFPVTASSASTEKKVCKIEEYLALDYSLDSSDSIIDFSFVDDVNVLKQLECDNREMMRYRYGLRAHRVDFPEFCRFVLLQAEMLLNYFYSHGDVSLDDIKTRIKTYNPNATIAQSKTLSSINFNVKLWAYDKEFKLDNFTKDNLEYVRKLRNEQSHRSPELEMFSTRDYQDLLNKMGLPLKNNGEVNWNALQDDKNKDKLQIYLSKVNNTDDYKSYCFLLWRERQPFEDVIQAIDKLTISVRENII